MSGPEDSRRAFLAGGTVVAASAAFVSDASAQSKMVINDPSVVREIEAEFAGYDRALASNDVAALNGFFFDSPFTIRYGNAENLYGHTEIQAFRSAVVASGAGGSVSVPSSPPTATILQPYPHSPGARRLRRSDERCKPGSVFLKAGELSPRTSAPLMIPQSHN